MNSVLKVVDRIPQIDSITLEEKEDVYILIVSYTPRYGFGMIHHGSCHEVSDDSVLESYDFVKIGDVEAWENWRDGDDLTKKTEIQLRFPERTYYMFMERDKETETYIFCKKSFFYNRKELFNEVYDESIY